MFVVDNTAKVCTRCPDKTASNITVFNVNCFNDICVPDKLTSSSEAQEKHPTPEYISA